MKKREGTEEGDTETQRVQAPADPSKVFDEKASALLTIMVSPAAIR